jgi:hypothetical protein
MHKYIPTQLNRLIDRKRPPEYPLKTQRPSFITSKAFSRRRISEGRDFDKMVNLLTRRSGKALRMIMVLAAALLLWSAQSPILIASELMLKPPGAQPDDHVGAAVDLDGKTMVVGASASRNYAGSAYVFMRNGGGFTFEAPLTGSDSAAGDWFGSAVAVSGETAVIGAPNKNAEAGAVYVFTRTGDGWKEEAQIIAHDTSPGDRFGAAVAIDKDTLVVGASQKNSLTGTAYVYTRSNGKWELQTVLTPGDAVPGDWFGNAVAVEGDTIAAGALFWKDGRGAVYVFNRGGSSWSEQAVLSPADGAVGDQLGCGVALSGDTLVAGAQGKTFQTGTAYVFVRTGSAWREQARLTTGDSAVNDKFGSAVSVSGNAAVIGTAEKAGSRGAAYVFYRRNSAWSQRDKLTASDGSGADLFGRTVTIFSGTVVVGAPGKDHFTGKVYVYEGVVPSSLATFNASEVTAATATLNAGLLALTGTGPETVYFEYGRSLSYGKTTPPQTISAIGSFSAAVTGLDAGAVYHFRARTQTDFGDDMTFTTAATMPVPSVTLPSPGQATVTRSVTVTLATTATVTVVTAFPPATIPVPTTALTTAAPTITAVVPPSQPLILPAVASSGVKQTGSSSVLLTGELTSLGTAKIVNVYFEYGTGEGYESLTIPVSMAGAGKFSDELSGLELDTGFHFRAKADNLTGGTAAGEDIALRLEKEPSSAWRWVFIGLGGILAIGVFVAVVAFLRRRAYYR